MYNDLYFDADYGSSDPMAPQMIADCEACTHHPVGQCCRCAVEAERTARTAANWNELARQRREAGMENDKRTADLALLLNVANRLTALNCDVTSLVLHDDNVSLKLLLRRISKAERLAEDVYNQRLEATHG